MERDCERRHPMPVCIVADSFRSAFNVGGVFRNAAR